MPIWCSQCGALVDAATEELEYSPGTRYHALLNSNEVPLDSDVPIIESGISKIDASLACIDDEIVQLHLRLKKLEADRDRLSSYRVQSCAILSPLRRIPSEIMGEIFSWTIPKDVQRGEGYSPWFLTHINRRWREVAISTSSLWSLVVVDFRCERVDSMSMLEIQIARAQKLKIHFYGIVYYNSRQVEIFRYLAQYSSRWEELYLISASDISPLLADVCRRVPSLRTLRIGWSGWLEDTDDDQSF
ncbi:hypothetical protein B0H12DRAFT_1192759, partial [Mycena haematopus]